jgi:hypothetical protein
MFLLSTQKGVCQDSLKLGNCIDQTIGRLGIRVTDIELLAEVSNFCIDQTYKLDSLRDFEIRREEFTRQAAAEIVTLWLVVGITISGVVLAGLRLLGSYKLATVMKTAFEGSSEIAIEQSKLSLKSSVTGLFILALSLAFFWLYVKFVYTIDEVKSGSPPQVNQQTEDQFHGASGRTPSNGLGPPPK